MFVLVCLWVTLLPSIAFSNQTNNELLQNQLYNMSKLSVPERSQDSYYNKISKLLSNPQLDTHSLALANILMADYYSLQDNFKLTKEYLTIAKPLVQEVKSERLQHEYDYVEIFTLRGDGQIPQAIEKADALYTAVSESWPKHKLSNLVLERAYILSFQYKYKESLELLEVALAHAFDSDDPYQLTETYNVFGILYSELNDNASAIMYFEKAVEVMEENPQLTDNSYLYSNLADSYRLEGNFDRAKELLDKSLASASQEQDISAIAFAHQMRSRILTDQGEYEKALNHLDQAIKMSEQIGEELFNYELHSEYAYLHLKLGNLDQAKYHLAIAEDHSAKQGDTDLYYFERLNAEILAKEERYQEAFEKLGQSYKNYRKHFNDNMTHVSNISREQLDQERLSFENKLLEKENALNQEYLSNNRKFSYILWSLIGVLAIGIFAAIWMIFRFKRLANDNHKLAFTDNLTKLPNRRHVFRTLDEHHRNSSGGTGTYSIILFDLDHFKSINDRFGHSVGDQVIQTTKDICRAILREKDTIGRIGGEEFMIILPETTLNDAYNIAERLREHFEAFDFDHLAQGLKVTSSFGVTEYLDEDESLDFVINRADRLLYKAKNEGRNRVAATFAGDLN
ncbi:MAG: diguanylate cyclase [Kangiellaceae bacterium]|nr:diguanylate cyclase [Kangiellaceae bacterium]